mmetsp:Transcript_33815/g.62142  ORF Transcript_33815/g.62142 Transcript_33815/m.62142 type:complete len:130 (+) Transcript_33815:328-717(+)
MFCPSTATCGSSREPSGTSSVCFPLDIFSKHDDGEGNGAKLMEDELELTVVDSAPIVGGDVGIAITSAVVTGVLTNELVTPKAVVVMAPTKKNKERKMRFRFHHATGRDSMIVSPSSPSSLSRRSAKSK